MMIALGGGCRIPLSWSVQDKEKNDIWRNVITSTKIKTEKDILNTIDFEETTSQFVRLQFILSAKESVGIYEFEVK